MNHYVSMLVDGTLTTISLMLCALSIGFVAAIILTTMKQFHNKWLTLPVDIFIFLVRGTPLLIQFFLIYYSAAQLDFLRDTLFWDILKSPFACAVIALSINTSAYTTVIFCGAIHSIPKGEIEACQALGMSKLLMLRRVILPRALQIAIPVYANEGVYVLKATSLASVITLLDLMGTARLIIAQTYASLEPFVVAGIIYYVINVIVIKLFKQLEIRYHSRLSNAYEGVI